MNWFSFVYNTILFTPLYNALIFLYGYLPDMGVAIIVLTVIIRLATWPLSRKSIASQQEMQKLQPKMDEIKAKYKNDQQRQSTEMMKLYKEHKVNPLSSCLPMLLPIIVLIVLSRVFFTGLTDATHLNTLYSFVPRPEHINLTMFGGINVTKPNAVFAVLAGLSQFLVAYTLSKRTKTQQTTKATTQAGVAQVMQTQMMYVMPVVTVFVGFTLPSALSLYWLVSNLLQALQQWLLARSAAKKTS